MQRSGESVTKPFARQYFHCFPDIFAGGTLELFPEEDSLTGGTKAFHASGRFVQVIYPSRNRQDYPLDY